MPQPRINGKFGAKPDKNINDLKKKKSEVQKTMDMNGHGNNPWSGFKSEFTDFASHFLPTDDVYGSSGSGGDDIPMLSHFQWLAERRLGIGWKVTWKASQDAVRNRFKIADYQGEIQERDDIFDWMELPDVDFYNQLGYALYFERVYGIGFLMKYYTTNDREHQDFSTPAPKNKKPIALQAFPPTVMTPTDIYRTSYLDTDPQKWTMQGGVYNSQQIHPSRVEVIMTRRVPHRWRGLSVFEPIWIPLMSYFQAQIFLLRGFARLGNMIPFFAIDSTDDLESLYALYADLIDEMKMNGIFIGRKGDEMVFAHPDAAQGLDKQMEIWKEDIAAGVSMPVPILWGRVASAGLGGAAYLMAERYYWNEISNIQASISDDIIRIIKSAGFKWKKNRIDWNLSITKTDQQRLLDEGMEIQNEILKEDLIQRQLETSFMIQNMKEGKALDGNELEPTDGNEKESKPESKKDFVIEKILEERSKIHEYMWGARKVA